jgi:hypothetical protein
LAPNNGANALDIAAWKRGFWRNKAASKVEPERGKPEMKCSFWDDMNYLALRDQTNFTTGRIKRHQDQLYKPVAVLA